MPAWQKRTLQNEKASAEFVKTTGREMSVIVVALTTVNEDNLEALSTYMGTTGPLLEQAQARIVGRYEVERTIVGENHTTTVTIVEYPDQAAVDSVFESAEYGWLHEVRAQAFKHYQIMQIGNIDTREGLTSLKDLGNEHATPAK